MDLLYTSCPAQSIQYTLVSVGEILDSQAK